MYNIIILNDTMYVVYGPVKEMPTCSMFVNLHYIIQYIILAMTVISILIIYMYYYTDCIYTYQLVVQHSPSQNLLEQCLQSRPGRILAF